MLLICKCVGVCVGCGHGSIRLSGSDSDNLGRVDICLNNVWGTVCQNNWGDVDARVVCRQLGFAAAGMFTSLVPKQLLLRCLFHVLEMVPMV